MTGSWDFSTFLFVADDDQGRWLTTSEVAEEFGVDTATVIKWANDGDLPHMRTLGGHRRFNRQVIARLVGERQHGEASA